MASTSGARKRATNRSKVQLKTLLDYIKTKPHLNNSKHNHKTISIAELQQEWGSIAANLNALGPAQKTWKGWRKVWQDLKSRTKNQKILNTARPAKPPVITDEVLLHTIKQEFMECNPDLNSAGTEIGNCEAPDAHERNTKEEASRAKEMYYRRKLEEHKEELALKARKVEALEKIAATLSTLGKNNFY